MKKILHVFFSFFFILVDRSFSQENLFQQEVNYEIHVRLDDQNHFLRGHEKIQYINRSDSTLTFIYFHLWPNAYRHPNTALGKQLFSMQNYIMFRLKNDDFGFIDSLQFRSGDAILKTRPHPQWEDVIKVFLPSPLKPNDTIELSTPFRVKIPSLSISRFGHSEQSYQITQWYPKPAVFDNNGWNIMPYLDQGEFYSEFGTFDVFITLPENYMVASSGILIEPEEEVERINTRIRESIGLVEKNIHTQTMDFPPSSPTLKTLHFRQFRIHDFAWFADKRYYILHDVITLPESGRQVDTWTYFFLKDKNLWNNALDYVNRSVLFFSREVGEFPYNQVTAVSGALSSASGMEYPNITVVAPATNPMNLDVVITHEVGHNWFYGILASNERLYPALDEGVNSFYEQKYVETYYPDASINDYLQLGLPSFTNADKIHASRSHLFSYLLSARNNLDQPIGTTAEQFSPFNYGAIVYSKTATVFKMLEEFMGPENFKMAMQFYFDKYKFTHPTPLSLIKTLQYFSGNDLKWFTEYFINSSSKTDLAIQSVRQNSNFSYSLIVRNRQHTPTPYSVSAFRKDGFRIGTVWMNPSFRRTDTVFFPPCKADFFLLDADATIPELYRYNNFVYTQKKIFKRNRPFSITFLTSIPNERKWEIYFIPALAYNTHDGPMAGILWHNYAILPKNLEWFVAPVYGTKSRKVSGLGNIQYSWFPNGTPRMFRIAINSRTFSLPAPVAGFRPASSWYAKNSLDVYWERKPYDYTQKKTVWASLSFIHIYDKNNIFLRPDADTHRYFLKSTLCFENTHNWAPFRYSLSTIVGIHFIRTQAELIHYAPLNDKFKFRIRIFGGTFLHPLNRESSLYGFQLSGWDVYRDFLYEGYFLDRNSLSGSWMSRQFMERDGAMKVRTALGSYARSAWSASVQSPKFGLLPLHAFFEAGGTNSMAMLREKILWNGGLMFSLPELGFSLYLPLIYSADIRENLALNQIGFWQTIRFSITYEEFMFRKTLNKLFLSE